MFSIDEECLEPKRDNPITDDIAYMAQAFAVSMRSYDPSTQVGSCYVDEDGKLLSVGCNQVPPGWDIDRFPWGTKEEYGTKNSKYTYIIHSEVAASHNYDGSLKNFRGGTLYVTLFPCTNCAKEIALLGIKRVVYLNARENCDDFEYANILLQEVGVECVRFRDIVDSIEGIEIDFTADEKNVIKIRKRGEIKNTIE